MNVVLIIGGMKCGTTSIYSHLCTHPAIFASTAKKEPSFFTQASPTLPQIGAYRALCREVTPFGWACEASTNYTKFPSFPGVPKRIHSAFPESRFVYILRQPVERIYSHYIHNLAAGSERRSFEEAVLGDDQHYINVSRYFLQLSQYLENFSPESILVLIFEDFIQNKLTSLQRVFSFLGIDRSFVPPNLDEKKNIGAEKTIDRPVLRRLESTLLFNSLPQRVHRFLKRRLQRPAPSKLEFYDPILHNSIMELLYRDVEELQAYLGVKITAWDF